MTLVDRFRGLADPTRLRIMNLLMAGELCGCDIQYVLGLSQPNVSRHLSYLRRSGLVQDARRGFRVYYRLNGVQDAEHDALFTYLTEAFRQDRLFRHDQRKLRAAIRDGACTVSERPVAPIDGARATRRLKGGRRIR